jgi:DNA-binding CsgD family transcriptional regulator
MEDKGIEVLSAKLDSIIKLMVLRMTEGKSQTEQIRLLAGVGFDPKGIAQTLGTTPNTVRVTLFNLRKTKAGAKRKR